MSLIDQVLTRTIISELGCKTAKKMEGVSTFGTLNQCFIYRTERENLFIKVNEKSLFPMYEGEVRGLDSIRDTETLRVPKVRFLGRTEGFCILILEYIELFPHTPESQIALGKGLARMHLSKAADKFGYFIDNTIGTTPQKNAWCENWVDFFLQHRLEAQVKLVQNNYEDSEVVSNALAFMKNFSACFQGIEIVPSLLHGDLWRGNTGADKEGRAVVYDPAAYFGHHEAEFGILTLFGGFTEEFYKGYRSLIAKDEGFEERLIGYQLYHALNHYNLFGTGYRALCLNLLSRAGI